MEMVSVVTVAIALSLDLDSVVALAELEVLVEVFVAALVLVVSSSSLAAESARFHNWSWTEVSCIARGFEASEPARSTARRTRMRGWCVSVRARVPEARQATTSSRPKENRRLGRVMLDGGAEVAMVTNDKAKSSPTGLR